tara:strand:+ start:8706 stop:9512 length:807 start_codon:yes stop_codon:yes gene_type:complete
MPLVNRKKSAVKVGAKSANSSPARVSGGSKNRPSSVRGAGTSVVAPKPVKSDIGGVSKKKLGRKLTAEEKQRDKNRRNMDKLSRSADAGTLGGAEPRNSSVGKVKSVPRQAEKNQSRVGSEATIQQARILRERAKIAEARGEITRVDKRQSKEESDFKGEYNRISYLKDRYNRANFKVGGKIKQPSVLAQQTARVRIDRIGRAMNQRRERSDWDKLDSIDNRQYKEVKDNIGEDKRLEQIKKNEEKQLSKIERTKRKSNMKKKQGKKD